MSQAMVVYQERASSRKRVFITDCEGPISRNDNAFELASHYIPNGDKFFSIVSKYDDVLADVLKRPNYKAGDTLRLILPFFKAYDVTNEKMIKFSRESILLVPKADQTLKEINERMPAYIVSTSYEPYIKALCDVVGFPFKNTFCTKLNIDVYSITEEERKRLRELSQEIANMKMIEIPEGAEDLTDFSEEDQRTIKRLDEIFFDEIPKMEIGRILKEINPIGGSEKANAIREIVEELGLELYDVMYVGDSITDVEAFRLVRENGGITISFNGNRYAVREAEIGICSFDTLPLISFALMFKKRGREGVMELLDEFLRTQPPLEEAFEEAYKKRSSVFVWLTDKNREEFGKMSSKFRKEVRGEKIGRLG